MQYIKIHMITIHLLRFNLLI